MEETSKNTFDSAENDGSDDRTVVVDRRVELDDRTVIVDRSAADENEDTVLVDRSSADDHDETILVDRSSDTSDDTILVDRSDESADETVLVDRSTESVEHSRNDRTAVVDIGVGLDDDNDDTILRSDRAKAKAQPVLRPPTLRGRRAIVRPAPIDSRFLRPPVDAPGPGAVAPYQPRPAPVRPVTAPPTVQGPPPTRTQEPSQPSVQRRSRRAGIIGLFCFVLACVVAVVGLVTVAVIAFG